MDRVVKPDVRPMDKWLTVLVGIAALLGCVLILDAGYPQAFARGDGLIFTELKKHIIFLALAVAIYFGFARIRVDVLKSWTKPAFYICFIGLILVFTPQLGVKINNASRWIEVGDLTIQPAEFFRIAAILFVALALSSPAPRYGPKSRDWIDWVGNRAVPFCRRFWPLFILLVALVLIEREPDLGTALMVGAAAFGALLFSHVPLRRILLWCGIVVLLVVLFIMSGFERYRLERFVKHADRWNPAVAKDIGFQPTHSELAMAMGGATGVGIGKGRAKYLMPAATTDFVYTTAVEELGYTGSLSILLLLGSISLRLILIAGTIEDPFRRMIVGAIGWWIGVQSVLNMLMAGALLPTVGIPLPFFSYGGSSLLALAVTMGIAQAAIRGQVAQEGSRALSRHGRRHRRSRLSRA